MKVYEVKAGWEAYFCETKGDADLVVADLKRRFGIIGATDAIVVEECDVTDIPEWERTYVQRLREAADRTSKE